MEQADTSTSGTMTDVRPRRHPTVGNERHPLLILGGGIGGLAAALALAQHGMKSHVIEKRKVYEPEGAGIQIGPNGSRLLASLGVADALEPLAGKPDLIHARDSATGATLARLPLGGWIAKRHGAPYWVLHRADLHQALFDAARASPLIARTTDFDAIAVENRGEHVVVRSRSSGEIEGSAMIAADGIRSMVRDEFFAGKPLRFAGKCAARAVIPATAMPKSLAENATGLWMSPKAHVVHYPVRGGSEVALVFVRNETAASDDWSASLQSSWVTEPARAFAKSLRDLLDVPAEWKKWSLYELPPLPTWVRGNICLLGDAAHPTLPFLAQGGVLAIEDAAVLARMIARRPDDICQGFTLYERERRPRATRVVAAAKSNGSIYHLDGFLAQARNAAMRISPPEMLMARYDWIYGYRA